MRLFYIFILIFFSIKLYAQDFSQFEFLGEYQPKWSYTSYDSNFVKHPFDPISTHYSGKTKVDVEIIEDQVIILEQTLSPANFLGQDGCIVHSLDKNTGVPNWLYVDNYYTGKRHREYFLGSHLNIDQDKGEISFSSIRDNSVMDEVFPGLGFTGRPSHRIISLNDGHEVGNTYNDDLTDTLFVNLQNLNIQNPNAVFFAQTDRLYRDSTIKLIIRFYEYEQGCENYYTSVDSIIFDTGINEDFPPLASTPAIDNKDDEKLRYLFFVNNPYIDTISIEKMYLKELIYEDSQVNELASVDMSDLITFPNNLDDLPLVKTYQGHTFITQLKREPLNWDESYMFAWYDQDYNKMGHIRNLEYSGKSYYDIYPISVSDEEIKFFSQSYNGDLIDLTLFSLGKNSNTIDSLTSIIIDTKGDNFWGIFDFKAIGTNEVLLQTWFSFDNINTGRTSNYNQYNLFEISGYGITNTFEETLSIEEFSIAPNPARNIIKIEGEGIINSSVLHIYSQTGQLIKEINYQDNIDVSELQSGVYFLHILDKYRAYKVGKFVKI